MHVVLNSKQLPDEESPTRRVLEFQNGGFMKIRRHLISASAAMLFAIVLLLVAPSASLAQGRGRGPDRFKKCGKFVNCHDARNGRWDNRGPRGVRVGRRFRDDDFRFRNRRIRRNNRGFIIVPRRRVIINRGDRDFDRDSDRDRFLRERSQERSDRFERRETRGRGRGRP